MEKNNQKNRKILAYFVPVVLLTMSLLSACEVSESPVEIISNDMTKPGIVTNVKSQNPHDPNFRKKIKSTCTILQRKTKVL